jgi:hypothetical protein
VRPPSDVRATTSAVPSAGFDVDIRAQPVDAEII